MKHLPLITAETPLPDLSGPTLGQRAKLDARTLVDHVNPLTGRPMMLESNIAVEIASVNRMADGATTYDLTLLNERGEKTPYILPNISRSFVL